MKRKILFIGNSYTYYHDMPEKIFAPLAAETGYDMDVLAVTHGGYKLSWFADPENEEGKRLRDTVQGKTFDYIVLQDHSLSTILSPEAFFSGIHDLKELLKDQTDHFLLYATWGRKPGCKTLEELGMSNAEMTRHIAEMYDEAAARFDMSVAHVGKAFAAYGLEHPDAELYFEDLHHSSVLGSTIAAQTILAAILDCEKRNIV